MRYFLSNGWLGGWVAGVIGWGDEGVCESNWCCCCWWLWADRLPILQSAPVHTLHCHKTFLYLRPWKYVKPDLLREPAANQPAPSNFSICPVCISRLFNGFYTQKILYILLCVFCCTICGTNNKPIDIFQLKTYAQFAYGEWQIVRHLSIISY